MLTPAEIDHYATHGYVIPNFRLPAETIEAIKRDHAELIAKHPRFADYCPTLLAYDTGFLNYARTPAIVDMVEQLIGPTSRCGTRASSPSPR